MNDPGRAMAAVKGTPANTFWLALTGTALVVFGANYIATTYYRNQETWARGRVADVMLRSQQLAAQARTSMDGDPDAFGALEATRSAIDADLHELLDGRKPYAGWRGAAGVGAPLLALADRWSAVSADAGRMSGKRDAVIALGKSVDRLRSQAGPLKARMDEIARTASGRGDGSLAMLATRQFMLADTLVGEAASIRRGEQGAVEKVDAIAIESVRFVSTSKALLCVGGSDLVQGECDLAALGSLGKLVLDAKLSLDTIGRSAKPTADAWAAERRIAKSAPPLLDDSKRLQAAFDTLPLRRIFPSTYIAVVSSFLWIVGLVNLQLRRTRRLRSAAGSS
jgi:hypothetical protein